MTIKSYLFIVAVVVYAAVGRSAFAEFLDQDRVDLPIACSQGNEGKACAQSGKLGYCKYYPARKFAFCLVPVAYDECTAERAAKNWPCLHDSGFALGVCEDFKWEGRDYNCIAPAGR